MDEGAKKAIKLRAKKAKERIKYHENVNKTNEDNTTCAEQKVAVENARNNARDMNVVATRTATDTKVFRGATKSKANTVAVKSELVKPRIEIDDDEKLEAIEGNKMGVVSTRVVRNFVIVSVRGEHWHAFIAFAKSARAFAHFTVRA